MVFKELHAFLEESVVRNLTGRCSGVVRRNKDMMADYMTGILCFNPQSLP